MGKWGYIVIVIIFLSISIIGCSENAPDEQGKLKETEQENDKMIEADHNEKERRTNFGEQFIESDDGENVIYLNNTGELYVYNHENEKEFVVQEDVTQFELFDEYVYYLVDEGVTSELDLPLQAIHRTNIYTKNDEVMLAPIEEDIAYTSPRAFYINPNGHIAIQQEVGFFYSNYWYDYFVTDPNFSSERPIITFEDEYDYVLNEVKWQEDDIFLLVDRAGNVSHDDRVFIELHSFSIKDGPRLLHENALPLSIDDYTELHDYLIYISVENDTLFLRAVDDDVEKVVYEVDLNKQEIINQYP